MPTIFLPELTAERAVSNRSIASIAQSPGLRKEGALAARKITARALERGRDAREVWQEVQETLKAGMSGDKAVSSVEIALEVAESWLQLAEAARGLWDEAGGTPERLDEVARYEEEARQVRESARKVLDFLTRPPRPMDAERLARGETDLQEGRYTTGEQMRAMRQAQGG